jgi:hypothetical protein
MSRASLKGTAYFWQATPTGPQAAKGDVMRMAFKQPSQVFLDKNTSNGNCTGCHSVAAKGDTLAAGITASSWGGGFSKTSGQTIWEVSPPSTNPIQTGFRAVSADGAVVASLTANVSGYFGTPLYFLDAKTGNQISGAPSYGLTSTPSFSSSGKLMAFSVRQHDDASTYSGVEYHDEFCGPCDIAIADYNSSTHSTANPRTLVSGQGNQCNVFPSATPDDARVAFARGKMSTNRWNHNIPCENAQGPNGSSLWIVDASGKNVIELANASAKGTPDELYSYRPMFSPVVQGGYFWLMFTSLRTYGNRLTETADNDYVHCTDDAFTDCRHQQVWVAAIDVTTGTTDPSHPAFWLPGQNTDTQNFDAQWALDACTGDGNSCESGFECCSGRCGVDGGKRVCSPPGSCGGDGDTCTSSADCCSGNPCVGGVCTVIPIN